MFIPVLCFDCLGLNRPILSSLNNNRFFTKSSSETQFWLQITDHIDPYKVTQVIQNRWLGKNIWMKQNKDDRSVLQLETFPSMWLRRKTNFP